MPDPPLQLYESLIETATLGICVVGRDGRLTYANSYFRVLTGWEPSEIVGREVEWLIYPEDASQVRDQFERRMRGERMNDRMEARLKGKNGKPIWCDATANSVLEDGRIAGVQVFLRDISAKKRAEAELQEWKNRYETAIETCGHVLYDWDPENDEMTFGGKVEEVLGYGPGELKVFSRDCIPLIHPEDIEGLLKDIEWILESRAACPLEYRIRRKDGRYILVEDNRYFFPDPSGKGERIVGTIADITEAREAERRLEDYRGQFRRLAEHVASATEKERSLVARELNDDLGEVLIDLNQDIAYLEREDGKGGGEIGELLERMRGLLDSALEGVRRISTALRPKVLDDLGLVAAIDWQAQEFSRRTGIACRIESKMEAIDLEPDKALALFRIFQETLTNAGLHSKADRVEVELSAPAGEIRLEVADNGIGIRKERLYEARSLGLLGMRERALSWGGRVEIGESPGGGTSVLAILPRNGREEGAE